mgnify:CR=1 FL=1
MPKNLQFLILFLSDLSAVDLSLASAVLATVYEKIEEIDENGNVIRTVSLNQLIWLIDFNETGVSDDGKLHYVTLVGFNIGV